MYVFLHINIQYPHRRAVKDDAPCILVPANSPAADTYCNLTMLLIPQIRYVCVVGFVHRHNTHHSE